MKIFCIVVTYNSEVENLSKSLNILKKHTHCVIVDNSSSQDSRLKIESLANSFNTHYFSLNGNKGIAFAQNVGVREAIAAGATDILLMDDDSIPAEDIISELLASRSSLVKSEHMPIIIGARAIASNGSDVSNITVDESKVATFCNLMMSSGCLIPIGAFKKVGFFEEDLFIDCVDFDWGWRAIQAGYGLYVSRSARINHSLGEGINRWTGMKLPSPIRHYYQYRNILSMISRNYVPAKWRLLQVIKLPVKLLMLFFFADRPIQRAAYALKGIRDFFLGKKGSYN